MSLLTEQEIRDVLELGSLTENSVMTDYRVKELLNDARAIDAKARANLLAEIKAQGPGGYYYQDTDTAISHNQYLQLIAEQEGNSEALRELETLLKLYRLPEGDKE